MPSTASSTAAALALPTSITVASAPADDTTVTALFTYRPPKLPGTVAPVSSPKLASAPSKSMSPYRPAPIRGRAAGRGIDAVVGHVFRVVGDGFGGRAGRDEAGKRKRSENMFHGSSL